ncbi:general transcription factor IIH subunit 1-like isoform X2 [Apostichopus japonicus]|uniref:general transcription factor IIH subunit 1-like isoform X2 n=1 Tax=Stichopus japonicus TaxID=307972 RepID=UPI003AB510D0
MATSSEEVLLVLNEVRHLKRDGSLYLMTERLAWQDDGKDVFSVSHFYADIKQQKISPDGSSKIQLQILLHRGNSSKFQFVNHDGPPSQLKDRDAAKELLQQLLPRFRSRANKELEQKNKMLQNDPELFQLYKDLVVSGVMTADQFWDSRKNNNSISKDAGDCPGQGTGVSAAFLSEIQPQADGCNGVKYNLTPDIIEAIFRIYPAVKKKHLENVPNNLSEKEFWTRFFQSQYFHRDRINTGSKDLFTESAKLDEKGMKEEAAKAALNPFLDIQALTDKSLDDGYGAKTDYGRGSADQVNSSIVKRFNLHNTRVLTASENADTSSSATNALSKLIPNSSLADKDTSHTNHVNNHNGPSTSTSAPSSSKRARLQEAISYKDLKSHSTGMGVSLKLQRTEGYYHGPMPAQAGNMVSPEEILRAVHVVQRDMHEYRSNQSKLPSRQTAASVLSELSPGGALMGGSSQQPMHTLYGNDLQQEISRMYVALSELLRHFWSCFPVSNKTLEEKLLRMNDTLQQFQSKKLIPFKESLARQHLQPNLTDHLDDLLDTAFRKFASWHSKKTGRGLT